MSRFSVRWRPMLEAMFFASLSACTTIGEPILGPDASMPITLTSRLLVADGEGVIGFDVIGQPPPFVNAVRFPGVSAAVVDSDILFVGRPGNDAIALFGDATRLHADRLPERVLDVVELGGPVGSVRRLRVDEGGTLWALLGEGELRAFFRATERFPDGSFGAAVFRDGTLTAYAYDVATDRLFAGSLEGRRIVVWEDALTRDSIGASSFELGSDCDASAMTLRGRLFVACRDAAIEVWEDPTAASASTPADARLAPSGTIDDLFVDGAALFAVGAAGVDIWRDASTASASPDMTIDVPGGRAAMDGSGTLFVSGTSDVRVVRDALGTPENIGAVRTDRDPLDIALY